MEGWRGEGWPHRSSKFSSFSDFWNSQTPCNDVVILKPLKHDLDEKTEPKSIQIDYQCQPLVKTKLDLKYHLRVNHNLFVYVWTLAFRMYDSYLFLQSLDFLP